jgi:hypothetical protein
MLKGSMPSMAFTYLCLSFLHIIVTVQSTNHTDATHRNQTKTSEEQAPDKKLLDLVAAATSVESDRAFHGHQKHSHSQDHRKGSRGGQAFTSAILDDNGDLSDDNFVPTPELHKPLHVRLKSLKSLQKSLKKSLKIPMSTKRILRKSPLPLPLTT